MSKSVLILAMDDIPFASLLQQNQDINETLVVDPVLFGLAKRAGLRNTRVIYNEIACQNNIWFDLGFSDAMSLVNKTDKIMTNLIPDLKAGMWFFAPMLRMARKLRWIEHYWGNFINYCKISGLYVLLYDQPQLQSANSFFQALYIIEGLNGIGSECNAFRYGYEMESEILLPDVRCAALEKCKYNLLVHLPTCFYDNALFEREIACSKLSAMALPSGLWNVNLSSLDQASLVSLEDRLGEFKPDESSTCTEIIGLISSAIKEYVGKFFLSTPYVQKQAEFTARWFLAQYIFYADLSNVLPERLPQKIILSDIDAGFHGPLVSLAGKFNIPIIYLPHSKAVSPRLPVSSEINAIILSHPGQGIAPRNHEGDAIPIAIIDYQEEIKAGGGAVRPLTVLGVILNDIFGTTGDAVDIITYVNGLRSLLDWATRNGVDCRIRGRPGYSFNDWLSGELGINRSDLEKNMMCSFIEFSKSCDLCLGYDTPTTGEFELIGNSIPLINISIRDLIEERKNTVNTDIVEHMSLAHCIARLNSFLLDEVSFFMFRKKQFLRYAEIKSNALPLREYLKRGISE